MQILRDIPEPVRAYLYRIGIALFAILALYGIISSDEAATWATVLMAILGVGESMLATANTSTDTK